MDESLVRYSKLSMMTATNRFSIYTHTRTHVNTNANVSKMYFLDLKHRTAAKPTIAPETMFLGFKASSPL